MSDKDQYESGRQAQTGDSAGGSGVEPPVSRFEILPYTETAGPADLYSFREAMAPPPEVPAPKGVAGLSSSAIKTLLLLVLAMGGVLLIFAFSSVFRAKPPAQYVDLGSQRFDYAGLSGRLIARWDKNASYELSLDPEDQSQGAGFAAVALDPQLQLSITLHLKDAAGLVACQKQILFPAPASIASGTKPDQALAPQRSATGDTVQRMVGQDGQVTEIDLAGPLPCTAKAYKTVRSWDFATDFPSLAEQRDWIRRTGVRSVKEQKGYRPLASQTERLPMPTEGDDEIVGDNPTRNTVETSSGMVFYLGSSGMRNRTAEWQVFPLAIHYSCGKNGACVLTSAGSRVSLQARLLK